jgi:hypothetical protein
MHPRPAPGRVLELGPLKEGHWGSSPARPESVTFPPWEPGPAPGLPATRGLAPELSCGSRFSPGQTEGEGSQDRGWTLSIQSQITTALVASCRSGPWNTARQDNISGCTSSQRGRHLSNFEMGGHKIRSDQKRLGCPSLLTAPLPTTMR